MKSFARLIPAAACAALAFPATAEDIDIYASNTSVQSNPNVLIVIDNSANWSSASQHWPGGIKQGQAELNALRTVVSEVGEDLNVGLMLFTPGSGTHHDGAYVRYHMRPMNATNKAAFTELIGNPAGCTDGANSLNGTPNCVYQNFDSPAEKVGTAKVDYSAALFEAFKYYGGYTSPAHVNDGVAGTPVDSSHFGTERYSGDPDPKADPAAYDGNNYRSPISSDGGCAKNYVIFIGNGFPSQDSPATLLSGVGGDTTQLELPEFTTGTVSETALLATTACGTHDSTAACATAAASTYGDAYASYSCTDASTCSAGSTTTSATSFGNSSCGLYADQSSCESALATGHPGYDSYSCAEVGPCNYTTPLSPAVTLDNQATCIDASNATQCVSYATTQWPAYASFSCTNSVNTGCSGGYKKWLITAAERVESGKSFTMSATATTTVTTSSTSHNLYGTRDVISVTPTGTTAPPGSTAVRYGDEWARYLNSTDVSSAFGQQKVTTYTIDVFKDQQDADETALLMSMANAGGGLYFSASDEEAIKNALRKIFSQIQAVNTVFASSSLPVSVNTQGTYLNQVFIGMFRPDGSAAPRWAGNLKQYQFAFFANQMRLADKNGDEAINPTTGFIAPCADSIWSSDSGSYWNFPGSNARGSCAAQSSAFPSAGSSSAYSDAPDGDIVEKGAAAQRLRGVGSSGTTLTSSSTNYATRNLKSCDNAGCSSLTDFNTANAAITAAALGVASGDRDALIDWVRGKDVDDENGNGSPDEVRPSVHGAVIHSQPAVIDFGGTTGVVAFYGADDGVLHAIDGGTGNGEGNELWGFVAPESYGRLARLRANEPLVAFPGIPTSITPAPRAKDYFFDGSIGVHQRGGTVWIFPTMRRGGRALYAFDVSNPSSPTLKWRKGCFTASTTDDSNCSAGWSGIGQSWSKPQVVYLNGFLSQPVLVFGGGYDTCEDADSQSRCTGARKGANIWFVNADTGALIAQYSTNYSVAGDVLVLKDSAGYAKYVYAVDTGGYVYRINVGTYDGTTLTGWSGSAATDIDIAYLSEVGQSRKFLFGPDVVPTRSYNAVLVGSGDREHPLWEDYPCQVHVTNRFFMIKDGASPALPNYPVSPITALSMSDITNNLSAAVTDIASGGWYFDLAACEQVVNKPLTYGGTVHFGTNQPTASSPSSCTTNLGIARGYAINFMTGNPVVENQRFVEYVGGGMPPSPVAGIVEVGGERQPFIIGGAQPGGSDTSPLQGRGVTINPGGKRSRLYWFKNVD